MLTNNFVADIAVSTIGNFGSSDWSIEFQFSSTGAGDLFPDGGDSGVLFIRSGEANFPYTGPSAFLRRDGGILLRVSGEDNEWCDNALPNLDVNAFSHTLKFEMRRWHLRVVVDGVLKCFKYSIHKPNKLKFVCAVLRFGGNHVHPDDQNLRAQLSNIKLVGDIVSTPQFSCGQRVCFYEPNTGSEPLRPCKDGSYVPNRLYCRSSQYTTIWEKCYGPYRKNSEYCTNSEWCD